MAAAPQAVAAPDKPPSAFLPFIRSGITEPEPSCFLELASLVRDSLQTKVDQAFCRPSEFSAGDIYKDCFPVTAWLSREELFGLSSLVPMMGAAGSYLASLWRTPPVKKILDIRYRVVSLPTSLLLAVRKAREARKSTNVSFIAEAISTQLPRLLDGFRALGFDSLKGTKKPARLPFSEMAETMKALRAASNETRLPVVVLLSLCLQAATRTAGTPKKRRGRPKRSVSPTGAS